MVKNGSKNKIKSWIFFIFGVYFLIFSIFFYIFHWVQPKVIIHLCPVWAMIFKMSHIQRNFPILSAHESYCGKRYWQIVYFIHSRSPCRRYIQKKIFWGGKFYFFKKKKLIFQTFFLLFTASFRSRPPGPPAVPGVFNKKIYIYLFFCIFLLVMSKYAYSDCMSIFEKE